MAENKVSVEISLEEKAVLAGLTKIVNQVQKAENSFTSLANKGDNSIKKLNASTRDAINTFKMASIPFKKIEQESQFSLRKTAEEFKNLENKSKNSIGVIGQVTSGISGGFKSLVAGVTIANLASDAIIGTANAIKSFVLGSINAAVEQENAINRLNQALRASGSFTQEASEDFLNFASAMQKTSIYGDEVVIGQIAVAKSFGASNEKAKELVQAAANLASTFGGSLETNMLKLGKTLSGNVDRLSRFIPELKNLTEEELKAGKAAEIVNARFSGAAANELKTYSGQVTALGNAYSDLQEELGGLVTNSNFVKTATSGLTNVFQRLIEQIQTSRIETEANKKTFVDSESKVNVLSEQYALLTARLEKYQQIASGGIGLDLRTVNDAKSEVASLTAQLDKLQYQINQSTRRISEASSTNPTSPPNERKVEKTAEEIKAEDEKYKKLMMLRKDYYAQLQISEAEYDAYTNQQRLNRIEITEENRAIELERLIAFETEKINASFLAEEQKIAQIADFQAREYAQTKLAMDKKLALEQKTADSQRQIDAKMAQAKAESYARITAITGSAFQFAAALAKDGSKEQFLIQKGAAIAEIALARGKAIALIPAQTAHIPYPGNIPAAATLTTFANAQAALGIATVAAQTIKGFAYGGIVGGNKITGDTIPARVNSGEMILNRQQQTELFKIANGSNNESSLKDSLDRLTSAIMSQPITISVDGRKIAESVRSQVQGGFRLA